MLLARDTCTPAAAIERLVGLQAQLARPPFVGLWTRLAGFERAALIRSMLTRRVVRVTGVRGTLHLMTSKDYIAFRGVLQSCFDKGLAGILGAAAKSLDLAALDRAGRAFFGQAPATFDRLREHLGPTFPGANIRHLAYAIRLNVPLVQVPVADAVWGYPAAAAFAPADDWLGKKVSVAAAPPHALIRRYLAAFGPASIADAQTWSGLAGLTSAFDELGSSLVRFRDERKRELFDLADAPRPDADTPAPVRYVPEFDNLVLGHHDRSRVVADEHRPRIASKNLQIAATFLVDGFVAGTWTVERKKHAATLVLTPFGRLDKTTTRALEAEGDALLRFVEPDAASYAVRA